MEIRKVVVQSEVGGWELDINVKNLYAKKKGFELFHYSYNYDEYNEDSSDTYIKVTDPHVMFCMSVYKDLGDIVHEDVLYSQEFFEIYDLDRDDPILVEIIEQLKLEKSPSVEHIKIIEIPSDIEYEIRECYDGTEFVQEKSRKWY